jgi:thiamine-monophosphate kinase
LARIQATLSATGRPSASLVIGIGDDAAVVAPARNAQMVLTTDIQIEGVHFERRFSTPADIGYRALAVNLSDLAAMGAKPMWALLSLAMPDQFRVEEVEALVEGVAKLGATHGVQVVGGNLSTSPGPLVVDVTAIGELGPRHVLRRNGGRPGDELWLSGSIGAARAGLEMLRAGPNGDFRSPGLKAGPTRRDCEGRYLRPEPRVRLGLAIGRARAARAAIDLSDGLADAAHQLATASGCGVEIDAALLPIDSEAREWWGAAGKDAVLEAVNGGDDYELLVAVPRSWSGRLRQVRARVARPPMTRIGSLTKDRERHVLRRDGRQEPLPIGFQHFAG